MTTFTQKQQALFDQCCKAIDAGQSFILTGYHPRTKSVVLRALREKYGWPEPAPLPDPTDSRNWMPEIEDETLPPGYKYWSQEAKDKYNQKRAEMIKHFMGPITDKLPKIGRPFLVTSSLESSGNQFRDLFIEAKPTTSEELKNK